MRQGEPDALFAGDCGLSFVPHTAALVFVHLNPLLTARPAVIPLARFVLREQTGTDLATAVTKQKTPICLCGLEIDDHFELGRLQNRQGQLVSLPIGASR